MLLHTQLSFLFFSWSVHLAAVIISLPPTTPTIHSTVTKRTENPHQTKYIPTYPFPSDGEIHNGGFFYFFLLDTISDAQALPVSVWNFPAKG